MVNKRKKVKFNGFFSTKSKNCKSSVHQKRISQESVRNASSSSSSHNIFNGDISTFELIMDDTKKTQTICEVDDSLNKRQKAFHQSQRRLENKGKSFGDIGVKAYKDVTKSSGVEDDSSRKTVAVHIHRKEEDAATTTMDLGRYESLRSFKNVFLHRFQSPVVRATYTTIQGLTTELLSIDDWQSFHPSSIAVWLA